ncbi:MULTISPECIES: hypothetical protein [Candidatus Accumulibacter]|uniref:Uncharacterized protein n=1 Tax=Candidatus Accumulibacter vicinus TaxID=2954382 RepID=A0A084XZL5_9PROT|nr:MULTISPECIES: hypothetical protein [Candidatus Accumulibacter]KFB67909.1 MAG: hypothetical protein CAPSK01_002497 [Candidatus Accumulibacter vicinus]MCM8623381.1 hypothetical protein [Accumulibacter sp.]
MKKIILGSVLAIAAATSLSANVANAASAAICSGVNAAGNGALVTAATDGTAFVRATFTPKCSANVHMAGEDNITYYRVGAASAKGKLGYGGSSVGGAVSSTTGTPCTGACTMTNATDALSAASTS